MADAEPGQEIEPANRTARLAFIVFAAVLLLAGVVGASYIDRLNAWLIEDPMKALERFDIMIAWLAALSAPVLIIAVFVFRSGVRAVFSERFPPRGMWVVVDTPIVTGTKARFRGRMMMLAALLMAAMAIGFPATLWYVIHSVAQTD